jgi:hypothetical protein
MTGEADHFSERRDRGSFGEYEPGGTLAGPPGWLVAVSSAIADFRGGKDHRASRGAMDTQIRVAAAREADRSQKLCRPPGGTRRRATRSTPRSLARPGFEAVRFPDQSVVEQYRNRWVSQPVQLIASAHPPALGRNVASRREQEHRVLACCQIERTTVRADGEPVSDHVHRVLLSRAEKTCKKSARADRVEDRRPTSRMWQIFRIE